MSSIGKGYLDIAQIRRPLPFPPGVPGADADRQPDAGVRAWVRVLLCAGVFRLSGGRHGGGVCGYGGKVAAGAEPEEAAARGGVFLAVLRCLSAGAGGAGAGLPRL